MTYLELAAWFLGATVLLVGVLVLVARGRGPRAGAVALTVLVLFVLTAVFDTLMIATGLFHYAGPQLLGIHIGLAPLEDFAYPLAGALLLPAIWAALRFRRRSRRDDEGSA
jgi:lycopene cyclase domain-containing protein